MTSKKSGNNKATQATSQSIQQQTQQYLESGGQINVIKPGVSGLNYEKSNKQITITSSKAKA